MPVLSPLLQRTLLAVGALGLLVAFVLVAVDCGQPIEATHTFDDAYMFQRYARHILDGHGAAWNAGEPATYGCTSVTHMLWVTVLMAVAPGLAPQDLALLSSAVPYGLFAVIGAVACLRRRDADPSLGAVAFAVWGFLVVPGLLVHGRSGMDTSLALLVGLGVAAATARWERDPQVPGAVGLALGGLLVWNTRPDLALVAFGVPGLVALVRGRWAVLGALVGTAALGMAVDLALKVRFLGSALPLPLAAKQHGAYQVYLGLARWNPGEALLIALALGAPFLVWAALTQPPRRLAVWGVPVALTWAYLCTVVQIMGYMGRFDVPALAWLFVLAATSAGPVLRERAVAVGAAVAVLFAGTLAFRAVYTWRVPEPPTMADPGLPELHGWTAMASFGRIAARLPGSTVAGSEHGLAGAMAPDTAIVDLVGLHDPAFARGEASVDRVFDARPAVIWLPPIDYPVLREEILGHPRFAAEYDFSEGAFYLGIAVRRDAPEARAAFVDVFTDAYGQPPAFRP